MKPQIINETLDLSVGDQREISTAVSNLQLRNLKVISYEIVEQAGQKKLIAKCEMGLLNE